MTKIDCAECGVSDFYAEHLPECSEEEDLVSCGECGKFYNSTGGRLAIKGCECEVISVYTDQDLCSNCEAHISEPHDPSCPKSDEKERKLENKITELCLIVEGLESEIYKYMRPNKHYDADFEKLAELLNKWKATKNQIHETQGA